MPSRIIKETVCTSPTIDVLTADEERCFYRLWTKCDDFGRYDGRPEIVLGACFPLKAARGEVTVADVEGWLRKFNNADLIQLYTVKGTRYLQVVTWGEHQQRRASKSKYPDPPPDDDTCMQLKSLDSNCEQMFPYSYSYSYSNSNSRTISSSKVFDVESDPYRLSILLRDLMLRNNARAKVPEATPEGMAKWAVHIDRMLNIDKRTVDEVEQVIRWSQDDEFWMSNILSTKKLRDQFDKLWLRMNKNSQPKWQPRTPRIINEFDN